MDTFYSHLPKTYNSLTLNIRNISQISQYPVNTDTFPISRIPNQFFTQTFFFHKKFEIFSVIPLQLRAKKKFWESSEKQKLHQKRSKWTQSLKLWKITCQDDRHELLLNLFDLLFWWRNPSKDIFASSANTKKK